MLFGLIVHCKIVFAKLLITKTNMNLLKQANQRHFMKSLTSLFVFYRRANSEERIAKFTSRRPDVPTSRRNTDRIVIGGLLVSIMLCIPTFASVKGEVKKGNALYNKEQFPEALEHYEKAAEDQPDSDVVNFNLGAALYKTGDYEKAVNHFEKALIAEDEDLEQKAQYNTGNAKYKYGINYEESNLQKAVESLEAALRHYERALIINSKDEDAEFNHDLVVKHLEKLREKMRQQEQSEGSKEKQQDSSDKKQSKNKENGQEDQSEQQSKEFQQRQSSFDEQDRQFQKAQGKNKEKDAFSDEQSFSEKDSGRMSQEQALMLLQSYGQNEEPKELYKGKIPMRKLPDVLKDW